MTLKITLTGCVTLESGSTFLEESALGGRQARLLFAVLVVERPRPVGQDELSEILWPAAAPNTWKPALRGLASKVRSFLEGVGLSGKEILVSTFGGYRLTLPDRALVDLDLMGWHAKVAEDALRKGDPFLAAKHADIARTLGRRTFLPGEHGTWVEQKRAEIQVQHIRALEILSESEILKGSFGRAVFASEEAIAFDPFRESSYRNLMNAHAAAGNRGKALKVYERCRCLLAEELGVDPSPETQSLYLRLLRIETPSIP